MGQPNGKRADENMLHSLFPTVIRADSAQTWLLHAPLCEETSAARGRPARAGGRGGVVWPRTAGPFVYSFGSLICRWFLQVRVTIELFDLF